MAQYTIRELSKRFQVPASTLRYYEEIGLIKNVIHKNNKHLYKEEHICTLEAINCFKCAGMSLQQIKEFLNLEDNLPEHIDQIIDLIIEQENSIKTAIHDLQNSLELICQNKAGKPASTPLTPHSWGLAPLCVPAACCVATNIIMQLCTCYFLLYRKRSFL